VRYLSPDLLVNLVLYVPVGVSGYFWFRQVAPSIRHWAPVVIGASLSFGIEMAQLSQPLRVTSAIDVVANTLGTLGGVVAAAILRYQLRSRQTCLVHLPDAAALALFCCWVLYQVFPLFPISGLTVLRVKTAAFLNGPPLAAVPLVSAAGTWMIAGCLLRAMHVPYAAWLLWLTLAMVPARLLIVMQQPSMAGLWGAILGCALFTAVGSRASTTRLLGWAMLAVLLLRGFSPFDPGSTSSPFSWIPFAATLEWEWQASMAILLEKLFYYGATLWALKAGGIQPLTATALTAATLTLIEAVQMYLPGRTAESTDPLLAVIASILLRAMHSSKAATRSA
jgi:VanZ family protein